MFLIHLLRISIDTIFYFIRKPHVIMVTEHIKLRLHLLQKKHKPISCSPFHLVLQNMEAPVTLCIISQYIQRAIC